MTGSSLRRAPVAARCVAVVVLARCVGGAACGGGDPIPAADLLLRVTPGAAEVEFGRAFPITVVRVWEKDLVPTDWSDRSLPPLTLRLEETTRREDARRIEETLRFRAYAFTLDDVRVAAPRLEAAPRSGGPVRTVSGEGFGLHVLPSLDRRSPGPAELPGEPLPEPTRLRLWAAVAASGLLAVVLLVRRARGRAAPIEPDVPSPASASVVPESPHRRALDRLRGLRGRRASGDPSAPASDLVDAAAIVREYVRDRFGLRALEMSSEELVGAAGDVREPQRVLLGDLLGRCDLVKFALHAPTAADRDHVLDAAERFVDGTRPADPARAPEGGAA